MMKLITLVLNPKSKKKQTSIYNATKNIMVTSCVTKKKCILKQIKKGPLALPIKLYLNVSKIAGTLYIFYILGFQMALCEGDPVTGGLLFTGVVVGTLGYQKLNHFFIKETKKSPNKDSLEQGIESPNNSVLDSAAQASTSKDPVSVMKQAESSPIPKFDWVREYSLEVSTRKGLPPLKATGSDYYDHQFLDEFKKELLVNGLDFGNICLNDLLYVPLVVGIGALVHLLFTPEDIYYSASSDEDSFKNTASELNSKTQFTKKIPSYKGFFVFGNSRLDGIISNAAYTNKVKDVYLKKIQISDSLLMNSANRIAMQNYRVINECNIPATKDKIETLVVFSENFSPVFIEAGYIGNNIPKQEWNAFWDTMTKHIVKNDVHVYKGNLFFGADENTFFVIRKGAWDIGYTTEKKVVLSIEPHNIFRCFKDLDHNELEKEYKELCSEIQKSKEQIDKEHIDLFEELERVEIVGRNETEKVEEVKEAEKPQKQRQKKLKKIKKSK